MSHQTANAHPGLVDPSMLSADHLDALGDSVIRNLLDEILDQPVHDDGYRGFDSRMRPAARPAHPSAPVSRRLG